MNTDEVKTIECWSTYRGPYQAPEIPPRVQGRLGERYILTSPIRSTNGRDVTTESGSKYRLGAADEGFVKWLIDNNYAFDPENPIKLVTEPTKMSPPAPRELELARVA